MTANLVTGFGQMTDYSSQPVLPAAQGTSTDFSDVLKVSTDKQAEQPKLSNDVTDRKNSSDSIDDGQTSKVSDKSDKTKSTDELDEKTVTEENVTNDNTTVADEKISKTEEDTVEDELSPEDMEIIAEAIVDMIQTIAEVLEVTPEDVEAALDTLGLQDLEVLDTSKLSEIAATLTGATDAFEVMTNEELYTDVKELMQASEELIGELAQELGVPVEELKSQLTARVDEIKENVSFNQFIESKPEATIEDTDEMVVATDKAEVREEKTQTRIEYNKEDTDVADESIVTVNDFKDTSGKNQLEQQSSENKGHEQNMGMNQTVVDTLKEAVASIEKETTVSYANYSNLEEIYEQVTDTLRTTMKADVTEMEMQLHPASLGNVRVQVAARDGVITANFTTQNEQVRQALEAQIVQLKEQMNEQGLKVEAIEVTVSSHAFEQNLSEEGERGQNDGNTPAKAKRTRGINLAGLDAEDIEGLDEEDRVTADIMARSGNTVDYLA